MTQGGILIVDDDPALLEALPEALRLRMGGVTVETADSAGAALDRIAVRDYDAIVTDIKMPGMDGLALLAEIRTRRPDTPTLMITAYGENDLIVGALRGGACDFIQKPIDRDYLITALRRAMEAREATRRVQEQQLTLEHHLNTLDAVVEERAHRLRGRKEGQFQLAGGGTLFLDEVVNLPLPTQAKLLRALQVRQVQPLGSKQAVPVEVRFIAASNVPLEREVRAGRFRQDVYYRLNEFAITLPPLRERDNILHLANAFLAEASAELDRPCRKLSAAATQVLLRYPWPGNVRELRNVIRRASLLASDVVEPEHLAVLPVGSALATARPGEPAPAGSSLKQLAQAATVDAEGRAIRTALQATRGNKSEAARLLRVDYKTLHLKMKQYGISAGQFRPS